jgi:hypothetical protein
MDSSTICRKFADIPRIYRDEAAWECNNMSKAFKRIDCLSNLAFDQLRCKSMSSDTHLVEKVVAYALSSNMALANAACAVFCKAIASYGCIELKGMISDDMAQLRRVGPYQAYLHSILYDTDCYNDLVRLLYPDGEDWIVLNALEICYSHLKPDPRLNQVILSLVDSENDRIRVASRLIAKKWSLSFFAT